MRPLLALLLAALTASAAAPAAAQALPPAARAVLGEWTVRSDEGGEAQAVIRFTESDGVVTGRIVRVLPTEAYPDPSPICADCAGAYRGADLRRVALVRDMRWRDGEFVGGRIVDPKHDRTYRATMRLEGPDRLRVRGYIGVRALGRTQIWERVRG